MTRAPIARTKIEALFSNGKRKPLVLSVSAPWKKEGSWWALPKVSGSSESFSAVAGYDSMQALTLSLKYLVFRLEKMCKEQKCRLVWIGTKKKYDLREWIVAPLSLRPKPTRR